MSTWVYVRSEPNLYTVGHHTPDGKWHPDSDHDSATSAAERVHWLNGGKRNEPAPAASISTLDDLFNDIDQQRAARQAVFDEMCAIGAMLERLHRDIVRTGQNKRLTDPERDSRLATMDKERIVLKRIYERTVAQLREMPSV